MDNLDEKLEAVIPQTIAVKKIPFSKHNKQNPEKIFMEACYVATVHQWSALTTDSKKFYICQPLFLGRNFSYACPIPNRKFVLTDYLLQCYMVLSSLQELHAMGLTHLDIKFDNILIQYSLDFGWFARLVDFGLAAPIGDLVKTTISLSSRQPPEKYATPDKEYVCATPAMDIYSSGEMFQRILSSTSYRYKFHPAIKFLYLVDCAHYMKNTDPQKRPTATTAMRMFSCLITLSYFLDCNTVADEKTFFPKNDFKKMLPDYLRNLFDVLRYELSFEPSQRCEFLSTQLEEKYLQNLLDEEKAPAELAEYLRSKHPEQVMTNLEKIIRILACYPKDCRIPFLNTRLGEKRLKELFATGEAKLSDALIRLLPARNRSKFAAQFKLPLLPASRFSSLQYSCLCPDLTEQNPFGFF